MLLHRPIRPNKTYLLPMATKKELEEQVKDREAMCVELHTGLKMLLNSTSNREAIVAVEVAKSACLKYEGKINSIES